MALVVKSSPYKAGDKRDGVQSLGWEDPLQEGMATRFSILVENPMDRRAWQVQSIEFAESDMTEVTERACTGPLLKASSTLNHAFFNFLKRRHCKNQTVT